MHMWLINILSSTVKSIWLVCVCVFTVNWTVLWYWYPSLLIVYSVNLLSQLITYCFYFYFSGDGRMDSPGHCAQYCTYTGIENDSKKVVSIITMDKRETEKKSTNLEKASFVKMMEELKDKDANVVEVVTDAHLQIGAVMSKQNSLHVYSVFFFFCTMIILLSQMEW